MAAAVSIIRVVRGMYGTELLEELKGSGGRRESHSGTGS